MASERSPLLRDPEDAASSATYQGTDDGRVNSQLVNEVQAGDAADKPRSSIGVVILSMLFGIVLMAMDVTIVASTYASIGSQFDSLQNSSWIATAYMMTLTSFQPLFGKLSDIFGRKTCLLFCHVIFALGCLWCGLAGSMTSLIAARALSGVGGAGMGIIPPIVMSDVVPLRKRGTWQGVGNLCYAFGLLSGAPIGGLLADSVGWRWAFLLQVPIAILGLISVSIFLHIPKRDNSDFKAKLKRIDVTGAVTLIIAVFALLLALDRGANVSWHDRVSVGSFIAFGFAFAMFLLVELRIAKEPFAPKHIIANRNLFPSYWCNFFVNAITFLAIFQVPLYLQAVQGLTPSQVGLLLMPSSIGGVTGSLLCGVIMQSTGKYYWLGVMIFTIVLVGTIIITLVTGPLPYFFALLILGLFLLNVGSGGGLNVTLISLIANAGPQDQAMATSVSFLFRSLGSVLGVSLGTTIGQNAIRHSLHRRLTGANVDEIILHVRESLSYIRTLEPAVRDAVIKAYEDGGQATMLFGVSLAAATILGALFIKEKPLGR